jgi:spore coat polysaccharide biosynthesis protein SpsF
MRIDATIQARVGSSRLPGKVLLPILGVPMLARQVERVRQSRLIERVIIATTTAAADDAVAALADELRCECFRGSEDDVLGRVTQALTQFDVDVHVELRGDNPLPDALLVDSIIGYFLRHADELDYLTNALTTTYPAGADVAVYRAATLRTAEQEVAKGDALREHVGLHMYLRPERFRIRNLEAPSWLRRPNVHLEVDTETDFALVRTLYEHFYPSNPGFSLSQVIAFLDEHPELAASNREVERRWKKFRSDDDASA